MKVLQSEYKLCLSCMEKHRVDLVEVVEQNIFKGQKVDFTAEYEYCSNVDTFSETEAMIRANDLALKDEYRKKTGLLTSEEIRSIREIYGISQKDLATVLDWGPATITRYENHQVQDTAHDDVLRTISSNPKWFLGKLENKEDCLPSKAYTKYRHKAKEQYSKQRNQYLRDAIYAIYANFEDESITGGVGLNLDKVIEAINYFAAKVINLHKVKLMKMLWYADALNYKRYGKAITGLVYSALPMGAVPEGYDQIVLLDGVNYDVVLYDDIAYRFKPAPNFTVRYLSGQEMEILDKVILELGDLNTKEIVEKMHQELAYKQTASNNAISYLLVTRDLSLD